MNAYTLLRVCRLAAFIGQNGFDVNNWRVMKAAFPLVYFEAKAIETNQEEEI